MSNVTNINGRISRQAWKQQRERARTTGFEFTLPDATLDNDGEPFVVRIRRISLQEKAAVNGISQDVQDEVYRRTRDLAKWHADQQKRNRSIEDQLDEVKNNNTLKRSVHVTACAVFIDPPLVETEAELSANPDAWHVDDFTVDDLWAVYQAATNAESKEAKSLKMFRPEPTHDVDRAGTVSDAAPSKRAAGASS